MMPPVVLGSVGVLFEDPAVTEIMANGPGPVWVDRDGTLEPSGIEIDASTLDLVIERIVAPLGRRLDTSSPLVDGRLPDGSRVHVAIPPVAIDGPCLTIRRFGVRSISLTDVADAHHVERIEQAIAERANVVVSGATSTGKTTFLNTLASLIPRTQRVVTIEDAAELDLPLPNVVRLEARPHMVDGPPPITIRDLVRNALRMRPDRLIVGEVRGAEALDMVQALNTGHAGSMSTVHANSATDALRRIESMVCMAADGVPTTMAAALVAAAVDIVVHLDRLPDGRRRVVDVASVASPLDES